MPSPLLNFSHTEICDFITKAGNHHEQALQGIPIQHPYALIKQSRWIIRDNRLPNIRLSIAGRTENFIIAAQPTPWTALLSRPSSSHSLLCK